MKLNVIVALTLFFCVSEVIGQISAITHNGQEVVLHQDGTWTYVEEDNTELIELNTNPKKFVKGAGGYLLKSSRTNTGIYMDKKWQQIKGQGNAEIEYTFRLKDQDAYGMLITERIQVPMERMADLAFFNASNVSEDAKIVEKEYRFVNGKKVLYLRMNARVQGIDFAYLGYFYSDENGTTQLLMYTGKSLLDEYEPRIEEFMNGFVVIP